VQLGATEGNSVGSTVGDFEGVSEFPLGMLDGAEDGSTVCSGIAPVISHIDSMAEEEVWVLMGSTI
jgi:hypothetical protein